MNSSTANNGLFFLRPYLHKAVTTKSRTEYIRLFNSTCRQYGKKKPKAEAKVPKVGERLQAANKMKAQMNTVTAVEDRIRYLKDAGQLKWPRITNNPHEMTVAEFLLKYNHLKQGEIAHENSVLLRGRMRVCRVAGKNLAFLDLVQDYMQVQVVCNFSKLAAFGGVTPSAFKEFLRLLQRGDTISVSGYPYVTDTGELSLNVAELPKLLSPALATTPPKLHDPNTRIKNRHIDLLVNRSVADRIRVRSHIIQYMREFLLKDHFMEVQTPIIVDKASGAIAKSFKTEATEFQGKELALRIAPELWLKRLVIGGMDRVFEIGPAFRNEGLDATHNPEFTTCEFYRAFTDLETLMTMSEQLFSGIAERVISLRDFPLKALPEFDETLVATPFNRVEFIPAIQEGLGQTLPDLFSDNATEELISIFQKHDHQIPARPTLPRLLDRLASIYIEPSCTNATFIIHHPACMAPLAKSFLCPKTRQIVSARAELFIQNNEIANMYEEENSPFEQRAKFVQQGKFIDDENEGYVDESYVTALETGLPPTGGWGAGIDRIVMLFSGAKRISDVLAFGSLRNVAYLANTTPVSEEEKEDVDALLLDAAKELEESSKKDTQ